jgi:Mrp family chromosome partitioning ATPase
MLHSFLGEIRTEFEYSIVEGPPATESNAATAMAQFADGIILVLSAHRTRRIMARRIKDALEASRARVLGTVLSDRIFPVPERLYRRL